MSETLGQPAAITATFGLTTLGRFAFTFEGRALPTPTTKKARALLAFLVMNRAADVSREQLLELFWPDFDPERARENLKVTLWSVRRSLRSAEIDPNTVIRTDRSVARWIAPVTFDVDRLTELADNRLQNGEAREALAVYRGDFLEGDFDQWTAAQRERIAALYERVLSRAASAAEDVAAAEALIARDPYNERAYATLAGAELAEGRARSAAQYVERCRAALHEAGVAPSAEFERRFGMLRVPDPAVGIELRLPFVARDAELGVLTLRCDEARAGCGSVTIVHGDAGIGKSSLLRRVAAIGAQRGLRIVELCCTGRETQTLGEWQTLFEELSRKRLAEVVATAGFGTTRVAALGLAAAFDGPTAVIVDDAHSLSGESFRFLGELIGAAPTLCVVIGARPEGVARLRTLLHYRCIAGEVRLDCLSDRDVESALRQAAGVQLSGLARVVFERTKGHPLYVCEMLAALVEDGVVARDERGWRLSASLDESLPLPATLRSFIEGRLTARGGVPAMVAGALALEPAASATELRAALTMDEAPLLDALDDLLSLGLLLQPEMGTQFAFSHDLVAEVALAMLNAGRRAGLHAAFASCLQASRDRDASMRQARHLRAASQPLAAGAAYMKAARQSRAERAGWQAADRAREGIAVVEQLESSKERDALLAELHCEVALANLATGDLDASLAAANHAVLLARSAQDAGRLSEALLARAAVSGWIGLTDDEHVDADEAVTLAERLGAPDLRARALVEAATAARINAQRDAALQFAREAYAAAKSVEQWTTAQRACAEVILTCCTWWNFTEAQRWVPLGNEAALRASTASRAAHYAACAALWYLLERYDDAEHDLALASRLVIQSQTSPGVDISEPPLMSTTAFNRYLSGAVAVARERWGEALATTDGPGGLPGAGNFPSAAVPVQTEALTALTVAALLARGTRLDIEKAQALYGAWHPRRAFQSVMGLSWCSALARACIDARVGAPDAPLSLRRALDAVEEHARRTPLEADVAFARLAAAAREAGSEHVATRATERAAHYRFLRRAAAGAAWGGGA
jgi:DNA-binding SARP family transcriptional activator